MEARAPDGAERPELYSEVSEVMIIAGEERQFTVQVQIRGSNRLPNGKRQNTVKQITCLDTTVDEVEAIIRSALATASAAAVNAKLGGQS